MSSSLKREFFGKFGKIRGDFYDFFVRLENNSTHPEWEFVAKGEKPNSEEWRDYVDNKQNDGDIIVQVHHRHP